MLIKAIFIIFKISSPKIRVCRLFDGVEYSRIYGNEENLGWHEQQKWKGGLSGTYLRQTISIVGSAG